MVVSQCVSTLKKPHNPPAELISGVTLGSSVSSGNVMGELTSKLPDTGCCIMGLLTMPGEKRSQQHTHISWSNLLLRNKHCSGRVEWYRASVGHWRNWASVASEGCAQRGHG